MQDSREALWRQFGDKPVDNLILSWGAPSSETALTDGSRLLAYQHSTTYDSRSSSEQTSACEVTFMAKAPQFIIRDIAMRGAPNECQQLARGRVGEVRIAPVEPAYPYRYPYPYRRYPF
ncbi:MAG: hypothetical protein K2Q01_03500 [Rickettsiales bacterium]|nr:hypothetical protein [Rickettsiales bacterium]